MPDPEIDVLLVGGGPTGLMLALELSIQNVSFRIVDKEAIRSNKSRALVVHSRSQELLDRHGIAKELVALGQVNVGARIHVNRRLVADVDIQNFDYDDTKFPNILFISQADTEIFLDQALQRHGKTVEWSVEAQEVVQDEMGVTVRLSKEGEKEEVRAKYVVGCDGAHSVVRRAAGMTFEGAAYQEDFILADVHVDTESPIYCLNAFMGQGVLATFPMDSDRLVRLIVTRPGGKVTDVDEPTLEDFQKVFDHMSMEKGKLYDPVWMTRFRLHHRIVNDYRQGRLFVAGDAAHIHSPAGGQGMNTGIQDAVNLGWKLGQVLRGEKADSLLDTYNAERHPIGERLLKSTDRMFRLAATTNPIFLFFRNLIMPWVIPWLMKNPQRRHRIFRFISQLGIRYRRSPIVGAASKWRGSLRGGDRAPDGDVRNVLLGDTNFLSLCNGPSHHLFLFAGLGSNAADGKTLQNAASGLLGITTSMLEVHEIFVGASEDHENLDEEGRLHKRYGFTEPGYVLIRPDGHIAHIGALTVIDELEAFVKEI